jgi:hypothetical protein
MPKTMTGIGIVSMLLWGSTAWGADNAALEEQVQELFRQNQQMAERIRQLEEVLAKQAENREAATQAQAEPTEKEGEQSLLQALNDHVTLTGRVEVEATRGEDFDGNESSDVTLATVEIGLEAALSDWSSARLLLLYEEGEEDNHLIVDEGVITLGNTEKFPFYLTAGKMYLPFGFYESSMISDPLTLELGETNDSAVQLAFNAAGFYGSVYGFNGDINETGEDDEVDSWGADVGYGYESEGFAVDAGIDWINNIGDSDAVGDYLTDDVAIDAIDEYIQGFATHAVFTLGPLRLIGEYVTALDEFDLAEIDFDGRGAEPEAMIFEASYTIRLFNRETVFALGWQTTDEALALGLPETRYLGAVNICLFDHTLLAFEYLHDEDYDESRGGTGKDGHAATVQLAVEY